MQSGIDAPLCVIVDVMQRDQVNQLHHFLQTLYRPILVKAQYITGSEKYLHAGMNCNYVFKNYSQAYGDIDSCLRHIANDNVLEPYIG